MRSVRPCPYDRIHHTQVALGMKCSPTVVVVVVVLLLNYIYASNTCICCTTLTLCGIVVLSRIGPRNRIRYSWTAARSVPRVRRKCPRWPSGKGASSWELRCPEVRNVNSALYIVPLYSRALKMNQIICVIF